MKKLLTLVFLAVSAGLTACGENPSGLIAGTGTLQQWGGDCTGTWILHSDSDRNYELTALATEFQEQDLRVRFALKRRNDVATVCMVGVTANVVAMTRL